MTGFGRGSFSSENLAVAVELKTVNNRFLDVNLRLPADLQSLEAVLKRVISARLSRGRVDVNLSFERTSEVSYELNRPLINGYLAALKQLQNDFNLAGEPDLNVIARLPGAMQTAREELDATGKTAVEKALETALNELEAMREREGESLKTELNSRLASIEQQTALIEPNAKSVAESYRAKLDISEELTRLKSHVAQFRETCESSDEIGKRLDFLTQELNREANTILSKATDLTIKEAALVIKAEIEKLREQVQNIE